METRLSERHIIALNFILVAILAYFAALSVNDVLALRMMPPPSASAAPTAAGPISGLRPRSYYQDIADRDIFNLVAQAAAPAPVVVEDLHLKLLGISELSFTRPYIIVEDRAGQQALYQVGDTVADAGKLIAVEKDRAIIDRGGHRVALELPKDTMPGPLTSAKPVPLRPAIDTAQGTEGADDYDPNVSDLGHNRYRIPRATVDHSLNNLAQLFTQIRAMPNIENGRTTGFALSEIEPGSIFDEMGLQDGDVLQTVDGHPVQDPMQAMQLLNTLRDRSSARVTVLREGKTVSLSYEIR